MGWVRNYQARNMLRDSIKKGDLVFFYYSSWRLCPVSPHPTIAREWLPGRDRLSIPSIITTIPTPKKDAPSWFVVDLKWCASFKRHHHAR